MKKISVRTIFTFPFKFRRKNKSDLLKSISPERTRISDEMSSSALQKKIGALNILKFLLVSITFLFHWNIHYSISYKNTLLNNFITAGAFSMSGFFILSGFLLYYAHQNSDFQNFSYLIYYFKKKLIKILPLSYFLVALMLLLSIFIDHKYIEWPLISMNIIPLQAFFPGMFNYFLNGGLWFISVLLFLYLLFPYFYHIVKSIQNVKRFLLFTYILGIFPLVINCYYPNPALYHLPYFRICEFLMGMITCKIFIKSKKGECRIFYILFMLLIIFFSVSILFKNNFFNDVKFGNNYMYYDTVILIFFPITVLQISKNTFLNDIFNNKFSDFLGNIAYSFYIAQFVCIYIVDHTFKVNNYYGMDKTLFLILSFLLNLFIAIIFYEIFEKRISKKLFIFFSLSSLQKNTQKKEYVK